MKFFCYLPLGWPSLEKSLEIARLYRENGCDGFEVSFPTDDPHREGEYIASRMKEAFALCGDYDIYMKAITELLTELPNTQIFPMVYQKVVRTIGAERFADFCTENGIDTILSADMNDSSIRDTLKRRGIKIASPVTIDMRESDIEQALENDGFVYISAFPRNPALYEGKNAMSLADRISKLKLLGLADRPFYCGGGIKKPEDIAKIRAACGDGFFLGSSLMSLYENTEELVDTVKAFSKAANN